jgi:hypothetical protein
MVIITHKMHFCRILFFFIFGSLLINPSTSSNAQTNIPTNQTKPTIDQQQPRSAQIDRNGLLLLVRQVLFALDLSNKSGNYTVLREISAPGFAAANDAARLSQLFRNLRDTNADLSGVLVYEPQLTLMPEITKEGLMRFAGYFPSASNQIKFEMIFAPVNGQWKIFGLAADIAPAGPTAPAAAPQSVPAPSVKQKK